MNWIAVGMTVLLVAGVVGITVWRSIGRVRFSLRVLLLGILSAATCVTLMLTGVANAEQFSLGLYGLLVWFAVLIAAVARAHIAAGKLDIKGEPPHGSEPDG